MPTTNEILQREAIAHAVYLNRYSNGVVRKVIGLLNKVDADLMGQLHGALDRLPAESFTVGRLESLLISVRALNASAYEAVSRELTKELREFVAYEAGYQLELFKAALPPQVVAAVGVAAVNAEQVYGAVMARPFQGKLLSEFLTGLEADRAVRIRDAVRIGYTEGQTINDIVRRLRGTKAKGYSDGLMDISRRHAESVIRTAISHTAGFTRDRFYEGNSNLIASLGWVSTLDGRTSEPCRLRDGLKYTPETHRPIGHKVPWLSGPGQLHWNCRSTSVPVTKSWRDLGIDADEMNATTRSSMDGQVPASLSYGDWLKAQSATRQDDILGAERGRMLRDGDLTLDRFYSEKGRYLSLVELAERGIE